MSKLRILIVEDEAVTAADLHDELTAQGCEVIGTADTAERALCLAEEGKPRDAGQAGQTYAIATTERAIPSLEGKNDGAAQ